MNIQANLKKSNISPDPLKDQFFLNDDKIIEQIIKTASLTKSDVVLEIGAGIGNLTRELAKYAGKVIAFEIDPRFKPLLTNLPKNVEVHIEDAWKFVQLHGKFRKRKNYNKIVSNLPYSFCEQLMHNLTFLDFDKIVLLVPLKFLTTLSINPVFKSFLTYKLEFKVDKSNFYPRPKTNSAVVSLFSLPSPIISKNLSLFLKQYIYQHEDQKIKNSLKEGLIRFHKFAHLQTITKNQAKKVLDKLKFDPILLDQSPHDEIYSQIDKKLSLRHFSSASS